jgi:ATP-dependent DNA ligase
MTSLPFEPPIAPMLAKPAGDRVPAPDAVPGGLLYEPKWDGFRALLFRDADKVVIQPRRADDLAYAFPEVAEQAFDQLPPGTVVDGELVSAHDGRLWFEELGMRLRPRSEAGGWKIAELSQQYPASFVAFDVLAVAGEDLRSRPNSERRTALERLTESWAPPFHRSPATTDPSLAARWFETFEGAGLDGVIARPLAAPYQPGKRTLLKVKHARTADVVVAGWRPHKIPGPDGGSVVGSLLLGLYDTAGTLHHVGVASSFTAKRRAELVAELAPYADPDPAQHPWGAWMAHSATPSQRVPGAVSRWTGSKDLSWVPVRTELVCEVGYDHMEGDRFRHVASFKRWRPDREPATCSYEQLDRPVRFDLADVLGG